LSTISDVHTYVSTSMTMFIDSTPTSILQSTVLTTTKILGTRDVLRGTTTTFSAHIAITSSVATVASTIREVRKPQVGSLHLNISQWSILRMSVSFVCIVVNVWYLCKRRIKKSKPARREMTI
jgi:hypothetical protein